MKNKNYAIFLLILMLSLSVKVMAQREANVSAVYTYIIGDNDDISLKKAKMKCVELAKAEAIKREFGELITSDVIDTNVETNGESSSSFFWENTVAMAKGEWLSDNKPAVLNMEYKNGHLIITAEVWGHVREIIQGKTDVKWDVLKDSGGKRVPATIFNSGERFYVNFSTPASGYVAVYLIVGDDETFCLLPYQKDMDGKVPVTASVGYTFFDKELDASAHYYRLTTKRPVEDNELVLIYSPNPFTKCNDITGDARHPNSLSTHDFQKWLLKSQRVDKDMFVDKKWVKIRNANLE